MNFGTRVAAETVGDRTVEMSRLKPIDDHQCFIFETDEEHRVFVSQYLKEGLDRGEKVIYVADSSTRARIMDYLRNRGTDGEDYIASGQLSVVSVHEAYLWGGFFDPDLMIALLRNESERALSDGYLGLRITGEMTWALDRAPGSERLIEYEAKLSGFSRTHQCTHLCQYDRRRFPPSILMHVILTHPFVGIGSKFYENLYYTNAPTFLEEENASVALLRCFQGLVESGPDGQVLLFAD